MFSSFTLIFSKMSTKNRYYSYCRGKKCVCVCVWVLYGYNAITNIEFALQTAQALKPRLFITFLENILCLCFSGVCMCAKMLQSCPTLCNFMNSSVPCFSVHKILQARILESVSMSSSKGSSPPFPTLSPAAPDWQADSLLLSRGGSPSFRYSGKNCISLLCEEDILHSHVWLFATLWTAARQAPLCMEFARGSSSRDLPNPGIKPKSLASPALASRFFTTYHLGSPISLSRSFASNSLWRHQL